MNRTLGSILLISGTSIGAGMLALPVATSEAGFIYSAMALIISWAILFYTGLLVLEANISLQKGSNFITMSRDTLGKYGEAITWITYLLLLYSLISAYMSALGEITILGIQSLFHISLTTWQASIPTTLIMIFAIYFGYKTIDYIGRIFIAGLVLAYIVILSITIPHVSHNIFEIRNSTIPLTTIHALPIIAAAFGYHVVIPSIRNYLHDIKKIKTAIFFGSLIPLIVYIIWESIIFGIIPIHKLILITYSHNTIVKIIHTIQIITKSKYLVISTNIFIVCAIVTSFLGISLSLYDFLSDGLKIDKRQITGKTKLILLTFIPPLLFVIFYKYGFILALSFAGIFVSILHIILPVFMVLAKRIKTKGSKLLYNVFGFKLLSIIALIFAALIILQY